MTSLKISWKRKSPVMAAGVAPTFFKQDNEGEESDVEDWRALLPHKKLMLEDVKTKSKRLMDEGMSLAEKERYWESIQKFDEALTYTPSDEKLYEMKSQILLELNEVFPAVEMAEKAVQLTKLWAEAYQTLGRSQLGIGRIKMALSNFCRAYHLKPQLAELLADINWCRELLAEKEIIDREASNVAQNTKCCVCSKETLNNMVDEKESGEEIYHKSIS